MKTTSKVGAAVVAVVVVLVLLMPLVREFVDQFGIAEDGTDSVVRSIAEWALAAVLTAVIYTCLVEGPRAFARSRKKPVNPR